MKKFITYSFLVLLTVIMSSSTSDSFKEDSNQTNVTTGLEIRLKSFTVEKERVRVKWGDSVSEICKGCDLYGGGNMVIKVVIVNTSTSKIAWSGFHFRLLFASDAECRVPRTRRDEWDRSLLFPEGRCENAIPEKKAGCVDLEKKNLSANIKLNLAPNEEKEFTCLFDFSENKLAEFPYLYIRASDYGDNVYGNSSDIGSCFMNTYGPHPDLRVSFESGSSVRVYNDGRKKADASITKLSFESNKPSMPGTKIDPRKPSTKDEKGFVDKFVTVDLKTPEIPIGGSVVVSTSVPPPKDGHSYKLKQARADATDVIPELNEKNNFSSNH
jgi:hypothetical protein